MIKKFKEFITESEYSKENNSFPSKEDIEDQLLRLKEVFGCRINDLSRDLNIESPNSKFIFRVMPINPNKERKDDIENEIEVIENRIKSIFPKMSVEVFKDSICFYVQIEHPKEKYKNKHMNESLKEFYRPTDIRRKISEEELEDQCLRLKEVFDCNIKYSFFNKGGYLTYANENECTTIRIDIYEKSDDRQESIDEEVNRVVQRIGNMYPSIDIKKELHPHQTMLPYPFYILRITIK